jgi:hypothetical protein
VVIAAIVAAVALSGGTSDQQLVMKAVNGWFQTSGSGACNYITPAFANNNYGGAAGCRQRLAGATAYTLGGTQQVSISPSGDTATDTGFTANGHPFKMTLVKQNGTWLVDSSDDLDRDAIMTTATGWAQAPGGSVCQFYSQLDLKTFYNGSVQTCQQQNATGAAAQIQGNQNVNYTGQTTATDSISLNTGEKWTLTMSKQSNGKWLIDNAKKTSG